MNTMSICAILNLKRILARKRLNELLNKFELYIDKNVNAQWEKRDTLDLHGKENSHFPKNEMAKLNEFTVVARKMCTGQNVYGAFVEITTIQFSRKNEVMRFISATSSFAKYPSSELLK